MADLQGNITKGPVLYYLDQLSRSDASLSRLGMLLEAIEQLQPTYRGLVDVFQQHLFPDYDPARLEALNNYLRRYWFDEAQGWWRPQQPIEPIFCHGLIKVLREAIDNPITVSVEGVTQDKRQKALPIDSYWLVVGERFEITVCRSLQQVTLLILTPPPPIRRPGIWDQDTPVWVVRRETTATAPDQAARSVVGELVEEGRVERDQLEQTVTNRIITVRVRHRTGNQ